MDTNTVEAVDGAPVVALPLFAQEQPLWFRLLVEEIAAEEAKSGKGKAGVAVRLGFGRAYVSRAIATIEGRSSGFPGGVPQSFIDRVLDRLHVIKECPATTLPQPRHECQRLGNGPAPTHNPLAMRIWKVCQRCDHRPHADGKE